jgi:hypothetical protein
MGVLKPKAASHHPARGLLVLLCALFTLAGVFYSALPYYERVKGDSGGSLSGSGVRVRVVPGGVGVGSAGTSTSTNTIGTIGTTSGSIGQVRSVPAPAPALPPSAQFKAWIEEGVSNLSLTYTLEGSGLPPPTPGFLTAPLPVGCTSPPNPAWDGKVRVLIFGDSVDRYLLQDGCEASGGVTPEVYQWGHNFTYFAGAPPSLYCDYRSPKAPQGTVAFLNVYGSAPRGPYYEGHGSHSEFCGDTVERVEEGLRQFKRLFGAPPDVVMFRAEVWDMHFHTELVNAGKLGVEGGGRAAVARKFVGDVEGVFAWLRARLPRAILGMHTVPTPIGKDRPLFFTYINAMRLLAKRHGDIFLVDWQALLSPLEPTDYNKDAMHPDGKFSGPFYTMLSGAWRRWLTECPREA